MPPRVTYLVPDAVTGLARRTPSARAAAAYVVAWAILYPGEAEEEGVPVNVGERPHRLTPRAVNLLDRAAVAALLRTLR